MTTDTELTSLRITIESSPSVELWIVKNRSGGQLFKGQFIKTTPRMRAALLQAANNFICAATENSPYGILEEPNESSVLAIERADTNMDLLEAALGISPTTNPIKKISETSTAIAYAIKIKSGQKTYILAKKPDSSWGSKRKKSIQLSHFSDETLDIQDESSLSISKFFDFASTENYVFVKSKRSFESILKFKAHFQTDYNSLKSDPGFLGMINGISNLDSYIGDNSMQLRRMAAVRQKGVYQLPGFIAKVESLTTTNPSWNIAVDTAGRIVVTEDNAKSVVQLLLNLRLKSELTDSYFDAPFANAV